MGIYFIFWKARNYLPITVSAVLRESSLSFTILSKSCTNRDIQRPSRYAHHTEQLEDLSDEKSAALISGDPKNEKES